MGLIISNHSSVIEALLVVCFVVISTADDSLSEIFSGFT